jgi:hypothetical protein
MALWDEAQPHITALPRHASDESAHIRFIRFV